MAPWPNDLSPSQYRDGSNLDARARLHALYGNVSWFSWVAERMAFDDDARVLDIGCGPGGFWAKASAFLPGTISLVLADLSPWMVSKALTQIDANGGFAHVAGCQANAAALPFPDASIDAVVAMHMLYHLQDPEIAIREIARVLGPKGALYVTTNSPQNMTALFDLRHRAFGGPQMDSAASRFGLDIAEAALRKTFGRVDRDVCHDTYRCTDPEVVFQYLVSMPPGIDADTAARQETGAPHRCGFRGGRRRLHRGEDKRPSDRARLNGRFIHAPSLPIATWRRPARRR